MRPIYSVNCDVKVEFTDVMSFQLHLKTGHEFVLFHKISCGIMVENGW